MVIVLIVLSLALVAVAVLLGLARRRGYADGDAAARRLTHARARHDSLSTGLAEAGQQAEQVYRGGEPAPLSPPSEPAP